MENIRHVLSVSTDRHAPKSGRNNLREHMKRVGKLPFLTWHFQETQRLLKSAAFNVVARISQLRPCREFPVRSGYSYGEPGFNKKTMNAMIRGFSDFPAPCRQSRARRPPATRHAVSDSPCRDPYVSEQPCVAGCGLSIRARDQSMHVRDGDRAGNSQ